MMRLPHSLQGRLLTLVLGLVGVVWLVAVVATWVDVRHELDELLDSHLAQAAALLVVQQAGELDDDDTLDAPPLHRYAPKVAFQVFHEGQLALRLAHLLHPDRAFRRDRGDLQRGCLRRAGENQRECDSESFAQHRAHPQK